MLSAYPLLASAVGIGCGVQHADDMPASKPMKPFDEMLTDA